MSSWCTLVMWQIPMIGHLSEISYVAALLQHFKVWKVERCINCSAPRQATSPSNCLAGLGVLTKCILSTDLFLVPCLREVQAKQKSEEFLPKYSTRGSHVLSPQTCSHGYRTWGTFQDALDIVFLPLFLEGGGSYCGFVFPSHCIWMIEFIICT